MHVVATAGHAGHGKSALVRALTGMDPEGPRDAWTDLPSGGRVAFVDAPGGEHSVPAVIAAAGPAPAVLFAVAADEGWRPRSGEHLAALDALGVRHGVLAVTRSDVADPRLVLRQARERLAGTSLRGIETVAVSTVTRAGIDELAAALGRLSGRVPVPDPGAPVRLWADRTRRAAGLTAVTGTLGAGTIRTGDELLLLPSGARRRVESIECDGEPRRSVRGYARVTVALRGDGPVTAAISPGRWTHTTCVDVRTRFGEAAGRLARQMILHIGSAAVAVRLRPLGPDTARLTLNARLALHVGDTGLLRDPVRRTVAGVSVLDVRPPTLVRRGAGAARARELASWPDRPGGSVVLRRHGLLRRSELDLMGCAPPKDAIALDGGWYADPAYWDSLHERLAEEVSRHAADRPLTPGVPLETARLRLGLPTRRLTAALVRPPLRLRAGRVHGPAPALPAGLAEAVDRLRADMERAPFEAPRPERLAELGLTGGALAAAERAGAVLRLADGVVLLPGADREALRILSELPQPFTPGQAGDALATSRRVAVALLRHLDGLGLTERRRS
ncbi:SelB C-terminal domain-containing protein [Actinomadura graeca]|uniref:SelB C-terminal domain-containing protein n=1 Tax=Actinomadura graeca TaxID=2750812 RepID=A0ABX8QMI3_9ACTN|nr:SelB C-terminal domain-containing protein [Actinomadura graeca]QXJ19945.1 SelB C-terminal domain-containing protein [Actinomadura graeca]